jgi:hypothetical protein
MTQTTARWWPGTLLIAALMSAPSSALATVVWIADFEEGNLEEWTPGINNEGNVEVLGEQVYMGQYAGKITVHPEDTFTFEQNRVDIQHQSTLTAEGADTWISGYYYLPQDAQVRNNLGFFESNESYQNVMDFWVEPKQGGGTSLVFGVGFLGDTVLWTGDFTAGVWHQIAIHVHWSTNEQMGSVDFWLDGVQVVTGETAKTKADGNTLFFQTGMHRSEVGAFTETVYIDHFIEADNMTDAQIMAPMMAGGAGGAGGMAGAGAGGAPMAGGGGVAGGVSGGMGGMNGAGDAGSPSSAGTMSVAGAAGSGGAGNLAAGGMNAGPVAAPTAGSGPVAMPSADTSNSGSSCRVSPSSLASSRTTNPTGLIAFLLLAAARSWRRQSRRH